MEAKKVVLLTWLVVMGLFADRSAASKCYDDCWDACLPHHSTLYCGFKCLFKCGGGSASLESISAADKERFCKFGCISALCSRHNSKRPPGGEESAAARGCANSCFDLCRKN